MEIDNYIKSLADNCYQVYQEMTGKTALSVSIDKLERPFSEMNYKKAVIIPYQNKEDNFDGRFVLGFSDEHVYSIDNSPPGLHK